jgi:hypothetical protein
LHRQARNPPAAPCTRDHFGKACIAAQEEFQRKFLKQVPKFDATTTAIGASGPAKQAKQARTAGHSGPGCKK